jgi:hypothetical protein
VTLNTNNAQGPHIKCLTVDLPILSEESEDRVNLKIKPFNLEEKRGQKRDENPIRLNLETPHLHCLHSLRCLFNFERKKYGIG